MTTTTGRRTARTSARPRPRARPKPSASWPVSCPATTRSATSPPSSRPTGPAPSPRARSTSPAAQSWTRAGAPLPHPVNLVRGDADHDPDLVAAPVPRVRTAQIALSEGFDVLRPALGGDVDDPPAYGVVAGRVRRIGNSHRHPWVSLDVPDLLKSLNGVDDDVLTVGVDPGLGQLG